MGPHKGSHYPNTSKSTSVAIWAPCGILRRVESSETALVRPGVNHVGRNQHFPRFSLRNTEFTAEFQNALIFPVPVRGKRDFDLTRPRNPRHVTRDFTRKAAALGYPAFRFHDLRVTHETLLLDAGVPVHVVAARAGHDPAVLLRIYAKRTRKADTSAASVIATLFKRPA